MSSPILSVRGVTISFAKKILFEELSFNIFSGDRICLIGKNGAGKTTLMEAIFGSIEFDEGERFIQPNSVVGYLKQEEKIEGDLTVFDYVLKGIDLDEYRQYLVDVVCQNLKLDTKLLTQNLSGGQKRRVSLARALILEPEILLLDEPTNHLDLEAIEWLENYLASYKGVLLVISHDRKFLERVSNKVFWLRAGTIKVNNEGYRKFNEWSQNIIDHEQRKLDNLEKKFEIESGWLQTGVTARRKRNIGRLHYLEDLRNELKETKRLVNSNKNRMKISNNDKFDSDAPQVIASFNNVNKKYGDKNLIESFSMKILRMEKIGIVGKNGTGKSTFLKMLVGSEKPDSGTIKLAKDLEFSYFDQDRLALKKNLSIKDFLCEEGSDYVQLSGGKEMHVCGYVRNFLFDPKDVDAKIMTLSGGQQNRLFLAKTLANPGNFLILDEPTNDLDMESLDILQNYLQDYKGTLLVVSHDRDFLDNVATTILGFEGSGFIDSYLGGYSDYLEYKNKKNGKEIQEDVVVKKENKKSEEKKSDYKELKKLKNEFDRIPDRISRRQEKIDKLYEEMGEGGTSSDLALIGKEIKDLQDEIEGMEKRWEEIGEMLEG